MLLGGLRAALALLLALLGAGLPASAQPGGAAPDHPLFTAPRHTAPTAHFDQQHLRLALRFDLAEGRVLGDATLRLDPLDGVPDTLVLAAAGLAIDSVRLGLTHPAQIPTPFRLTDDALRIPLDSLPVPGVPFVARVFYTASPRRGLRFAEPSTPGPQVWTPQAPGASRHWIPSLDAPGDLLTSELLITADTALHVFAAGRPVEALDHDDGTRTTYYRQDRPHPLRRLLFAVGGTYATYRDTLALPAGDPPIPLAYQVFPDQTAEARRTLGRTPDMLAFFAERLNLRFPAAAYTQMVLPALYRDALVSPGAAALPAALVLDARAALTENPDGLLASAVARQWVSTLAPPRYWTDAWLEEGLAAYLSALFIEHDQGSDAFALAMQAHADRYLDEARRYRRPLVWSRWDDPARLYDAHSAAKGAWVFHMLRHRLGDEAFWAGLERYLADNAYDPVDTAALHQALEAETGDDLDAFFAQWVGAAGHLVLDVAYTHDAETGTLAVTVTQQQSGAAVPGVFRTPLTLEAHTLTDAQRFEVMLEANTQVFTLPLEARPRFVLADPDQILLTEPRVAQSARAWVGQLRQAANPAHRLQAARALAAFADDPALSVGLRSVLNDEPVPAVRQAILETTGLLPPSTATQRLLIAMTQDEAATVRAAALAALGSYTGAPEVHDAAFQAAQHDSSYAVQAEAVMTLARTGSPVALDVIRSALITPSHGEVIRRAAFSALAFLSEPPDDGLALGLTYSTAEEPASVRAAALSYLARYAADTRAALDRLIERLADADPRVRQAAIESLGRVDTARALDALQRHQTEEPDPLLRALAKQLAGHRDATQE